jgi:arsenate reductase-like glutaredoxin family protein
MRVIGINTCSTCRQAMKDLAADGKDPAFIDLRKDGFPDALLADVLAAFGNRAVNRAAATWRGLDEAERSRPPQDLLADYPALLKRPAILAETGNTLGWKEDAQTAHLGK